MKAKQTIAASAALAALAMAWWRHHLHCARKVQLDEKCMEEALATFEGEGGLVT